MHHFDPFVERKALNMFIRVNTHKALIVFVAAAVVIDHPMDF